MAVDIERFVRMRPYVYHLTARENLAALRRTMLLEPAASLMRRAGRSDLLRWRRPGAVRLDLGGETIVLKDQAPLDEKYIALHRDWEFADFIEYLNELVFFWPGTAEGPVKSGLRMEGYEMESSVSGAQSRSRQPDPAVRDASAPIATGVLGSLPMILRVPTAALLANNSSAVPLFCPFNSGAAREPRGRRTLRGPRLFTSAAEFPRRESEVVEVAFRSSVVLPEESAWRRGGDWELLRRAG